MWEFYDNLTGASFFPRGMNYINVSSFVDPNAIRFYPPLNASAEGDQASIILEPGYFDADLVNNTLYNMSEYGYNVVRIFITTSNDEGTDIPNNKRLSS